MKVVTIFLVFFPLAIHPAKAFAKDDLYGKTDPVAYLIGNFEPLTHPSFVDPRTFGIPTHRKGGARDRWLYLRKEATLALKAMYRQLTRDLPGVELYVWSGTRRFSDQKKLWESRWDKLADHYKNPLARGMKLLETSSMPGTSRHHWGTDLDINIPENHYFETGDGLKLYNWLKVNAGKYGFFQPYTKERTQGYTEEKWHWSYYPLANQFLKDWKNFVKQRMEIVAKKYPFKGARDLIHLAPIYVESIASFNQADSGP